MDTPHSIYSIFHFMNIDMAGFFSALANETRLRCLYLVATNGEICVCEIVEALGIAQPSASKSLNSLKAAGVLNVRREANWNYFSLNDAMPRWMAAVVETTARQLAGYPVHVADQKRFKQLDLRSRDAVCP